MIEEVDRLSRTVNRYLQFARGEPATGRGPGTRRSRSRQRSTCSRASSARARSMLERSLTEGSDPVALDPESLKQVFLNLVLNGLEASPAGSRVRVSLERDAGRVVVTIEDSGPGIPAQVLTRLGEPFVTTKAQGTGLGLFIAQRLVHSSDGTLEARNVSGGGARVTLSWRRQTA